jgi:hypothetical protein
MSKGRSKRGGMAGEDLELVVKSAGGCCGDDDKDEKKSGG